MNKPPNTPRITNPRVGQACLFKYSGTWTRGEIRYIIDDRRVSIFRPLAPTPRLRKSIYARSLTQLYEAPE